MGLFDRVVEPAKSWQTKWRSLDGQFGLYEECAMLAYALGAEVPVPDGLYRGTLEHGDGEGAIVVLGRKVIGVIPWYPPDDEN